MKLRAPLKIPFPLRKGSQSPSAVEKKHYKVALTIRLKYDFEAMF
jgi:hypothetical protein